MVGASTAVHDDWRGKPCQHIDGHWGRSEGRHAMLSREDQRRFDQIARHLRTTDPEFVARTSDPAANRHNRAAIIISVLLWAVVPLLAFFGGWIAAVICAVALSAAGVLALRTRRW
jgi:hypothetical protein